MALVTWSVVVLLVMADGISGIVGCSYGLSRTCPGESCLDIYHKNHNCHGNSGQYIVKVNDNLRFVYCDMSLECGGEKGWMRIADINAAGSGSCPNGWKKMNNPTGACRAPRDDAGCYSAYFSTYNIPYSRVCGMVVGYQKGTPDAFLTFSGKTSINDAYLDGVSITYGSSRKHLWSYAAGISESYSGGQLATCPCSQHGGTHAPTFVRDHYYCESGSTVDGVRFETYFTADPLWDGKGCGSNNNCCVQPNLPWFYRQIPLTSNDNVEARICYDQAFIDEAVLVKEIQLFVQ